MDDFGVWLLDQINERGWTQAELARRAKVSRAAISLILSEGRRPGHEVSAAIARAFNIPPEQVFQAAGILEYKSPTTDQLDELMHLAVQLTDADRDLLIDTARMLLERERRHV